MDWENDVFLIGLANTLSLKTFKKTSGTLSLPNNC